jgi:hypothetical protein
MKQADSRTISERIKDNDLVLNAMDKAVHDALRVHKLLGQPIVTWQDGKVKIVPPEEIVLDESNGNGVVRHD